MFKDVNTELSAENVVFTGNVDINLSPIADISELIESNLTPAQNIVNADLQNAKVALSEDMLFNEGLSADELRICAAKAKGNIMRRMSVASANTASGTPIDVSSAIPANVNTLYTINGLAPGKHLLVKVETTGIAKLTSAIYFSAAMSVGSVIFTVDENSVPTIVADSINVIEEYDVLSCLPKGSPYYVLYTVYAGTGEMVLRLQTSESYDSNEPNDAPSQAILRHEEVYLQDTFDNSLDTDYVHLQITKPETMILNLAFVDKHLTGTIKFGIYHKSDENGNAVNRWILKGAQLALPTFGLPWENTDLKGDFYIYLQYESGDILNRPYVFCLTPASKLPCPLYIKTGEKGMTGVQSGYIYGYHWVMGGFKVISDFRDGLSKNVDGLYPCFVTQLHVIGKDQHGREDPNNIGHSGLVITTPDGITTISALLPWSYGQDNLFHGAYFEHRYDVNRVLFTFLTYDPKTKQAKMAPNAGTVCEFEKFLNVQS